LLEVFPAQELRASIGTTNRGTSPDINLSGGDYSPMSIRNKKQLIESNPEGFARALL
jgi:hypothetical protein